MTIRSTILLLMLAASIVAQTTVQVQTGTGQFGDGVTWLNYLDGDLVPDYAVSAAAGQVRVFSGAQGTSLCSFSFAPAGQWEVPLNHGDFNGDGFQDLVVGAPGSVGVFDGSLLAQGNAPGLFSLNGGGAFGAVIDVADLNGDGVPELLVGAPLGEAVYVYQVSGTSLVQLAALQPPAGGGGNFGYVIAHADVSGDGAPDILVGSIHNRVDVFDGATRAYIASIVGSANGYLRIAGLGDINGDGREDFIVGNPTAAISTVYSGLTLTAISQPIPNPGDGNEVTLVGDQTGDGVPDFSVSRFTSYSGGSLRVYSGVPTPQEFAVLSTQVGSANGFGHAVAGGTDFDGDGRLDLLIGARYGDAAYVVTHLTSGCQPLLSPPIQIVTPGQNLQLNLSGQPNLPFLIAADIAAGATPTPIGTLGLAMSQFWFPWVDGIGLFGPPSSLWTLDGNGTWGMTVGPIPSSAVGLDLYLQALTASPTCGFKLSSNGATSGNTASNRVQVVCQIGGGSAPGTTDPQFDFQTSWPIEISDVSNTYASGQAVKYTTRSRTFHRNDVLQLRVRTRNVPALQSSQYRVTFQMVPVAAVDDCSTMPSSGMSGYEQIQAYVWSYQEYHVEVTNVFALQNNQAYTIQANLEHFDNGTWVTVDTTMRVSAPLISPSATNWRENIFYVTDARHVVLVHGWNGTENTFGDLEMLLETQPSSSQRRPVRSYRGDTTLSPPAITTQAADLDSFMVNPNGITTFPPDFVAHSMGGLIVRQWILDHMPLPGSLSVVCVGTPHYGVPCAQAASVAQGRRDMRRGSQYLRDLAASWSSVGSIPVRFMDVVGLGDNDNIHGRGDGLVPSYAATMQRENGGVTNVSSYTDYYLGTFYHTSALNWNLPCTAPPGANYLVPVIGSSHATYQLTRDFIVLGNNSPNANGCSSICLQDNRAALWVERATNQVSAYFVGLPAGLATEMWTNNDASGIDVDVYVFPMAGAGPASAIITLSPSNAAEGRSLFWGQTTFSSP